MFDAPGIKHPPLRRGPLLARHDDPRLVPGKQHRARAHECAHAGDAHHLAEQAAQLAPVQRDVQVLGVRVDGKPREAGLLRAADDFCRMHVALRRAEFPHDGSRPPRMAQPRFRRDADAARLQRPVRTRQGADFIHRVVQAIEEHDDVEFVLEPQRLVVADDEVEVFQAVVVLEAAGRVDRFRYQVLADHVIPLLREQHAGPARAAAHVQQASAFRHQAHHGAELHQVHAALGVRPRFVRGVAHAVRADVLEIIVFALRRHVPVSKSVKPVFYWMASPDVACMESPR